MKKTTSSIIIILILLLLAGCSGDNNQNNNLNLQLETNNKQENRSGTKLTITNNPGYINSFSEDLAWAFFDEDSRTLLGCFDKTGKIVYKTYDSIVAAGAVQGYSEGYCYIFSSSGLKQINGRYIYDNQRIAVIDKNGNVLGSYQYYNKEKDKFEEYSKNSELCVAYGGGCVVIQKHVADFDSNHYEYTIYDENKNILTTETYDKSPTVRYLGKGVFAFSQYDNTKYYFKLSGKWIDFDYYDDISFDCDYQVYSHNSEHVNVVDIQGNKQEIDLSDYFEYIKGVSNIHDNKFIVTSGSKEYGNFELGVYDMSSHTLKKLNKYLDKIDEEKAIKLSYVDDRLILNLKGSDGDNYFALLDENLNTIIEPTKVNSIPEINSGRFIWGDNVCDLDGNVVFSISSKFTSIETVAYAYIDGCLRIGREEGGIECVDYIDVDGNLLFEIKDRVFYDSQSKVISLK